MAAAAPCSNRGSRYAPRLMQVHVNGKPHDLEAGATVKELLRTLGLGDTLVAVERNESVVPRAKHESTTLTDGDQIEVVHFVGGG